MKQINTADYYGYLLDVMKAIVKPVFWYSHVDFSQWHRLWQDYVGYNSKWYMSRLFREVFHNQTDHLNDWLQEMV